MTKVFLEKTEIQDIANTIREKNGTETQYTPSEMPQGIESVYDAGYEKGKTDNAKEEQEKSVTITKNGTTEVLPDDGKVLSKVNVEVDVKGDDSLAISLIQRDITEIDIPYGITKIGDNAFKQYRTLTRVSIPNTVTTLGYGSFYETGITSIDIPNSVTSLNCYQLFCNCGKLSEITIPYGIKEIGVQIFMNCKSLKTLVLPESITNIENMAFLSSGITTINLPKSVTRLETQAFQSCSDLANLTVECEIKKSFNLSSCSKLTKDSAKSVLIHLADYKGTANEGKYQITFHSNVWDLLYAEGETSPDGTTWAVYVDNKGWNY